jgi:hypothetical protein
MIAPFEASRLKIERAREHLQELEIAVDAYFSAKPSVIVVERFPGMEPHWQTQAWIARIRQPVPHMLSTVIGDVVHNLRTALDLLACDLVRIAGRTTKQVYFPFCETAAELPSKIKDRNLHRAGQDVVREIESLKPYKGGNTALRAIHDMDVADKHQALLPLLGAASVPLADLLQKGRDFPVQEWSTLIANDGQIVIGIPGHIGLPLGTELPSRWFLALIDLPSIGNREVIQFLHELAETADRVLNALASLRPGAVFPVVKSP